MSIIKDPEGNEITTLHAMVNIEGLHVLEIGCGEGRLTWRYADKAATVTAIDPDGKAIEAARLNTPDGLKDRVLFIESTIEDFAETRRGQKFDMAIFAWSL